MRKNISVYVHIPFCKSKCYYCDFKSFVNNEKYFQDYLEVLKEEIKSFDFTNYTIDTIFFGGGTPTILPSKYICDIMEILSYYKISENAEITIECNPATADFDYFRNIRKSGINRLSVGVQSTNDELLNKIGRVHKYKDVINTFENAKKAGFENINADLIMSLPNQTIYDMEKTLEDIFKLDLQHLSVYSLIIEEDTVFGRLNDCEFEKLNLPSEEVDRETYHMICQMLSENNYKQYEISNFAKIGFECRHNINYWQRAEYIGFGVSSHSLLNKKRFANTNNLKEYLLDKGKTKHEKNSLSKEDEMEEFIFLGLRMLEGVDICKFKKEFGEDFYSLYKEVIEEMQKLGFLEFNGSMLRLTDKGIDVSETVIFEIITKCTKNMKN